MSEPPSSDPRLTLCEYRDLVRAISPPPTHEQITAFVLWVTHAHSWYKSGVTPGEILFQFYLDPSFAADEATRAPEYNGERTGFFNWVKSAKENRSTFHFLQYAHSHPSMVSPTTGELLAFHRPVLCGSKNFLRVPIEIEVAGRVAVSGAIHNRCSWGGLFESRPYLLDGVQSLEEPLRTQVLEQIATRRKRLGVQTGETISERLQIVHAAGAMEGHNMDLEDDESEAKHDTDDLVMWNLLRPERLKQRAELRNAIVRMLDVAYG